MQLPPQIASEFGTLTEFLKYEQIFTGGQKPGWKELMRVATDHKLRDRVLGFLKMCKSSGLTHREIEQIPRQMGHQDDHMMEIFKKFDWEKLF